MGVRKGLREDVKFKVVIGEDQKFSGDRPGHASSGGRCAEAQSSERLIESEVFNVPGEYICCIRSAERLGLDQILRGIFVTMLRPHPGDIQE